MKTIVATISLTALLCSLNRNESRDKGIVMMQTACSDTLKKCDTLSIDRIHEHAHLGLSIMSSEETVSDEKIFSFIKMYNTFFIDTVHYKDSVFSRTFKNVFYTQFLPKVSGRLDLITGTKLSLYSVKHDIFIGYSPRSGCNDVFVFW